MSPSAIWADIKAFVQDLLSLDLSGTVQIGWPAVAVIAFVTLIIARRLS